MSLIRRISINVDERRSGSIDVIAFRWSSSTRQALVVWRMTVGSEAEFEALSTSRAGSLASAVRL